MATPTEREAVITDSVALTVDISLDPELCDVVPETVRHFLSDADIRFKDSRYAIAQLSALASTLVRWEHELDLLASQKAATST